MKSKHRKVLFRLGAVSSQVSSIRALSTSIYAVRFGMNRPGALKVEIQGEIRCQIHFKLIF